MNSKNALSLTQEAHNLLAQVRDQMIIQVMKELNEELRAPTDDESRPPLFAMGCYVASRRDGRITWKVVQKSLGWQLEHRMKQCQVFPSAALKAHLMKEWPGLETVNAYGLGLLMGIKLLPIARSYWKGLGTDSTPSRETILAEVSAYVAANGQPEKQGQ